MSRALADDALWDAGEGSLDIGLQLRVILAEVLTDARRKAGRDRYRVAGDMSRLSGGDVTKNMLDRYTAPSADAWRFPAELIPALCLATGDYRLLERIVQACGRKIAGEDDARLAEIGEAYLRAREAGLAVERLAEQGGER